MLGFRFTGVRGPLGVALAGSAAALTLGLGASSASAASYYDNTNWLGHGRITTRCESDGAGMYWAHVTARMWVYNTLPAGGAHAASNMRLQVKLVPTTSGASWLGSYPTATNRYPAFGELLNPKAHGWTLAVNSARVGLGDWKVQIKLVWDRHIPHSDVVLNLPDHPLAGCPNDSGTGNGYPTSGSSAIGVG